MTDPIRAALERAARELELSAIALRQSDLETFAERAQNEAHAARAALAKHSSPKIDHFLGAISDEQIRDLAEFDFNFDRFNQVDQDESETITWECSDSGLIQFARFLISGGRKL